MKIKRLEAVTAYVVMTDESEFNIYTRYSPDNWTRTMGESEEMVYDCAELEAAFQLANS